LDLAETNQREQGQGRATRPNERPQAVEAEHGRQGQGDPHVKVEKGRAPHQHAEAYRQPDLSWSRALASGALEEGADAFAIRPNPRAHVLALMSS
jgi:hypothetical protein